MVASLRPAEWRQPARHVTLAVGLVLSVSNEHDDVSRHAMARCLPKVQAGTVTSGVFCRARCGLFIGGVVT